MSVGCHFELPRRNIGIFATHWKQSAVIAKASRSPQSIAVIPLVSQFFEPLRRSTVPAVLFVLTISAGVPAAAQTASETVMVTGISPLPGTPIDANKIPGEIETFSVPDLTADRQTDVLPTVVATQLSSVSLNDEQGSQFQPDFVYHGFEASPISGVAEGVAVYQDGVRLNESFGDNVNWDLIPEFAVNRFTLQSNNPVFGLNALGGR